MPLTIVTLVLSSWLFASAFLWPHTTPQRLNTWFVAVVTFVVALTATMARSARYLNVALAVWLFVSAFAIPSFTGATIWNNAVVAVAVLVVVLVPVMRDAHVRGEGHEARSR